MDVIRRASLLLLLVLTMASVGCAPAKTSNNVVQNPVQKGDTDPECMSSAADTIPTSFIVQWENGKFSVEKSENIELFKEKFITPKLDQIRKVEFDRTIRLDDRSYRLESVSASATAAKNWGQGLIHASAAWDQGIKGKGVTVAIVDTPVDYNHPQLKNRMVPGWDFVDNLPNAKVPHSHATHIAGVIGGEVGGAVQGIAPEAQMMGVSFMDADGAGSLGDAIKAMNYAADHGAKIINNSWGGDSCSLSMKAAMQALEAKGVLLLVAAGNDGADIEYSPTYPAAFNLSNQITVAAGNVFDAMAGFSNDSFKLVHLAAPGDTIYSSVPIAVDPSGYANMSGTSMATPFVSGAAALLLGLRPSATPAQLRRALLNSVDVKSYRVLTRGRLNVENAIAEIKKLVP
jgi:subtilisin family serine protease